MWNISRQARVAARIADHRRVEDHRHTREPDASCDHEAQLRSEWNWVKEHAGDGTEQGASGTEREMARSETESLRQEKQALLKEKELLLAAAAKHKKGGNAPAPAPAAKPNGGAARRTNQITTATADSLEIVWDASPSGPGGTAVSFYAVEMRSCCADAWTALPVRFRAEQAWVDSLDATREFTFRVITHYTDNTVVVGPPSKPLSTLLGAGSRIISISQAEALRDKHQQRLFNITWSAMGAAAAMTRRRARDDTSMRTDDQDSGTIQVGGVPPELTDQHDIEDIGIRTDSPRDKARRIRQKQLRAQTVKARRLTVNRRVAAAPGPSAKANANQNTRRDEPRLARRRVQAPLTALTAGSPGGLVPAKMGDTAVACVCALPLQQRDDDDSPKARASRSLTPTDRTSPPPSTLPETAVQQQSSQPPQTPEAQATAEEKSMERSPPVSPLRDGSTKQIAKDLRKKKKKHQKKEAIDDTTETPAPQQTAPDSKLAIDTLLEKAESYWSRGDLQASLRHYDDALDLACEVGDGMIEGMVLAGKGCALASTEERSSLIAALDCYERSKKLAEAQGMAAQAQFMTSLIDGTMETLRKVDEMEAVQALDSTGSEGDTIGESSGENSNGDTPAEEDEVEEVQFKAAESPEEQQHKTGDSSNDDDAAEMLEDIPDSGADEPSATETAVQLLSNATFLSSCGSSPQQRLWELELLQHSRVHDDKVMRVVMWQLSAHDVLQLILGRPAPPPADFNGGVISYTREQALKLSRKVAEVLGFGPADVSTRVVKATRSAQEIAATVYIRTESLVAKIHAAFDNDGSGYLSYLETRNFLGTIRSLDPNDYTCFCDSVGADPAEGIDRDTLLQFYQTCEPSSLADEFQLLSAHFSSQPAAVEVPTDTIACSIDAAEADDEAKEKVAAVLSHEQMVKKIYEEFDADGDGRLSFDEFSVVLSSMCTLTLEQFAVLCASLGMQLEAGLTVPALTRWYENEASLDQLHLDYDRVVLGLESAPNPSGNPTTALPVSIVQAPLADHESNDSGRCSQYNCSCSRSVSRRVNAMMESCQYKACVELLSGLIVPTTDNAEPPPCPPCGKTSVLASSLTQQTTGGSTTGGGHQSEEACRQSFLRVARGNALFKLSDYTLALMDYESALTGSRCEVSGELQRRIRICKLKQRSKSGGTVQSERLSPPLLIEGPKPAVQSQLDLAAPSMGSAGLFEDLLAEFKAQGGLDARPGAAASPVSSRSLPRASSPTSPAAGKKKKKRRGRG